MNITLNRRIIYFVKLVPLLIFFCSAAYSQINFISPKSTDTLLTGQPLRISWAGTTVPPGWSLYYSNDDGKSWLLIKDSIMSDFYDWKIPDFDSLKLRFKIVCDYIASPDLLWEIINAHNAEIRSVDISGDGKYILSSGADTTVKIWDIQSKKTIDSIKLPVQSVFNTYFFHGSDTIIAAVDSSIYIWDRNNRNLMQIGKDYFLNIVRSCAVHPYLPFIAASSYDGTMKVFSILTGDTVASFNADDMSNSYSSAISKDGSLLMFSTYSGDSYIYSFPGKNFLMKLNSNDRSGSRLVWTSCFSPDNSIIATGGVDNKIRLWQLGSGNLYDTLKAHTSQVRALVFHPGGKILMSGSLDGTIRQWSIDNDKQITSPINHGGPVLSCGYSPTGDSIVTAGRDNSIRLWKNFESFHFADSVNCIVKYPLFVGIPNIRSKVGDFFIMPLIIENKNDIPDFRNKKLDLNIKIGFPSKLMDIRDSFKIINSTAGYDTLEVSLRNNAIDDTLINIESLALFAGSYNSDILDFINFRISNSDDYYIEKYNGLITISGFCGGIVPRDINFSASGVMININPNPVSNDMSIELYLLEEGFYNLYLYDLKGGLAKTLLSEQMKPGDYYFYYNVYFLKSGYYFLRLETPSGNYLKKIMIIR